MSFDISGTYMTSWQQPDQTYVIGPVVVVNADTISMTVDGVTINKPIFAGSVITWQAETNNPSSGALSFYQNNGTNGFVGSYVEGDGPLPQGNNLFGTSAAPAALLSSWNATYTSYDMAGGKSTKEGTVVIASPNVLHDGASIQNYAYTGVTTPNGPIEQLSWFSEGGNSENVIIQFSKDNSGNLTFYGTKWTTGAQPTGVNFTGTTASSPPANQTISVIVATVISQNAQTNVNVEVNVHVNVNVNVSVEVLVLDVLAATELEPNPEIEGRPPTRIEDQSVRRIEGRPAPGSEKLVDTARHTAAADDLVAKAESLSRPAAPFFLSKTLQHPPE